MSNIQGIPEDTWSRFKMIQELQEENEELKELVEDLREELESFSVEGDKVYLVDFDKDKGMPILSNGTFLDNVRGWNMHRDPDTPFNYVTIDTWIPREEL